LTDGLTLSLGVVLYEMLPASSPSRAHTTRRLTRSPPGAEAAIEDRGGHIFRLDNVVLRALPRKRPNATGHGGLRRILRRSPKGLKPVKARRRVRKKDLWIGRGLLLRAALASSSSSSASRRRDPGSASWDEDPPPLGPSGCRASLRQPHRRPGAGVPQRRGHQEMITQLGAPPPGESKRYRPHFGHAYKKGDTPVDQIGREWDRICPGGQRAARGEPRPHHHRTDPGARPDAALGRDLRA